MKLHSLEHNHTKSAFAGATTPTGGVPRVEGRVRCGSMSAGDVDALAQGNTGRRFDLLCGAGVEGQSVAPAGVGRVGAVGVTIEPGATVDVAANRCAKKFSGIEGTLLVLNMVIIIFEQLCRHVIPIFSLYIKKEFRRPTVIHLQ